MKQLMLVTVLLFSTPAFAGEHFLNPMLGATDWSRNSGHSANNSSLSFDNDTAVTLGFKYLYRFDNGLALGGSFIGYNKDVSNKTVAHKASIANLSAVIEYYFNAKGANSPFIGFGLGGMGIGFDGGTLDGHSSGGRSIQLNAGMLFKLTDRFGMQVEYQYNTFDMDESIHSYATSIETYSHSILLGLTIHL